MKASQRVVVNTVAQYTRTLISMVLSLYTVRIVLSCLGQSDFGLYNLVAGVVAMLSFFTNSLSSTTQRFVSYYQGRGIIEEVKNVFNNSLVIHLVLGLLLVLILESIAPLLFDGFLNIAEDRIVSAKTVYQTVVIMIFVNFVRAPYSALLISHENIVYMSIIETLEAFLKVGLVLLMAHSSYDKLVLYGFIMLSLHVFICLSYIVFCYLKYEECVVPSIKRIQKKYVRELTSFAGWTIYGSACLTGRDQGIAILLNKAFGTVINGAWGLGIQVAGYTNVLSGAIVNAMRPQIVKAEGSGNRKKSVWLSHILSKLVFFLISIIGIPFIFEIDRILEIWLGNPPENSSFFCIMFIIALLFDALTIGLTHINNAIGDIKKFTIIMNTPKLMTLLIAIILMKFDTPLSFIMIAYIFIEACCSIIRIPLIARQAGFSTIIYIKDVIVKEMVPVLCCAITCFLCVRLLHFQWRFVITFALSSIIYSFCMYFLGLTSKERIIIKELSTSFLNKFKR